MRPGEPGSARLHRRRRARLRTGWWHELLLAHPEIRPPRADSRALHFFDRFGASELNEGDIAAYHAHFPRCDGTICGEWTGRYMFDAWTPPLLRRAAPTRGCS